MVSPFDSMISFCSGDGSILEELDFEKTAERGREKIQHPGTFNANPVSATAGITALKIIERTDAFLFKSKNTN